MMLLSNLVFIHGEKDPLIPSKAGKATVAAVPHAFFECIQGMGHMLFNRNLEDIVIKTLIKNFASVNLSVTQNACEASL